MHKPLLGAAAPVLLIFSFAHSSGLAQTTAPASKSAASTPAKQSTTPPLPTPGSAGKPGDPPPPAHPITVAQARELMALNGTDKIKAHLVDNVDAYMQRFPPFVPQDVKDDVRSSVEKMDIDGQTVATYQRYLSTEDAAKAIEFYKTPAGKDLLDVTPAMMGTIQQNASKTVQQTLQAAIERHKPEIEAAQKTYEQQHAAPSLGAPGTGSGSSAGKSGASAGTGTSGGSTGSTGTTPKKPQ